MPILFAILLLYLLIGFIGHRLTNGAYDSWDHSSDAPQRPAPAPFTWPFPIKEQ